MIAKFSVHWMPDVQVDYEYRKGDSFRVMPNSIQPPSPPQITKLMVTVSKSNRTVDITDVLPGEILEEIMSAVLVEINNNEISSEEYDSAFMEVSDG